MNPQGMLIFVLVAVCVSGTVWHELDGNELTIFAHTTDPVGSHYGKDWGVLYELPPSLDVIDVERGEHCSDWPWFAWARHGANPDSITIIAAVSAGPGAGTPLPPLTVVEIARLTLSGIGTPEFALLFDDLDGYEVCNLTPTAIEASTWGRIKAQYR